jgi:hypothetical protein
VAAGGEVTGGSEAGHAGANDDGIVDGHVGCCSVVVVVGGCS